MPTDNLNAFNKTQMKIMEHDDLDKFMNMINKNKPSALQVMKDEIAEDENNHFIVENRKLKELLKVWLEFSDTLSVEEQDKIYYTRETTVHVLFD